MNTPMQELIQRLKQEQELILKLGGENERMLIDDCIELAEAMLEKEKEVIMDAHKDGAFHTDWDENTSVIENAQDYYNETFNTKKK